MSRSGTINEIIKTHINVDEHIEIYYFYIEGNNLEYDLIFNRLWLNRNDVWIVVKEKAIYFNFTSLYIKSTEGWFKKITSNIYEINDTVYASWMRWVKKQDSEIKVFTTFITDIEKILCLKLNIDSLILLSKHYYHKLKFFQFSEAEKLLPLQESDIDYKIKLKQINSKNSETL